METDCPLHLFEGARTEHAPNKTSLGGFCLKPDGEASYMGGWRLNLSRKLSGELEKSREFPGKRKLLVILSGRSVTQVSFNDKPRTCWTESEQHCWK